MKKPNKIEQFMAQQKKLPLTAGAIARNGFAGSLVAREYQPGGHVYTLRNEAGKEERHHVSLIEQTHDPVEDVINLSALLEEEQFALADAVRSMRRRKS